MARDAVRTDVMQALDLLLARNRMNRSDLARACGVKVHAMCARFARRSDVAVSSAAIMADAVGFDVALVPKGSDLPAGSILIAVGDEDAHSRS